MIYVGVDLHLRFCYMTVLDASGRTLQQGRVPNEDDDLRLFFKGLKGPGEQEEPTLVAVEACGFWCAFVDVVEPLVERVVLVHPAKVKAIASAKLKNDRVDSQTLAQLLRADLLPEAWKADVGTRDLRELLRMRTALGRDRTRYKNQIHATLHLHGERAPVSDLFGRAGRAWLKQLLLRPAARQALDTNLRMVEQLDQEVHVLDRQLQQIAKQDPDARCLMSIPGIGAFTALVLKAEIGDIRRFPDKKSLYNYAGLVPVIRQSAEHLRRGGITRAGSRQLRWVMSEAALTAARYSAAVRGWFERLAQRKHPHVARTALARKLLGAVWALWTHGVCFDERIFAAM
ncbi:MAG: IS110 family transposase [Candidatus Acidiferrales bacterium]